nr:sialidase family protein [Flavihumibacter fluvii]
MQYLAIRLFGFLLFCSFTSNNAPIKEFIFGKDPGFEQCHASTVVHLKNGPFLAAWFGGKEEKADDVGIWLSRRVNGHWDAPKRVAKLRNNAHWNPVLFQSPSGRIFLYFKVGKEIPQWETWVQTSDDDGKTWSVARELVAGDHGGRGPVKNKPIVLSDGSWLAGASHEENGFHVFLDRSNDQGKTWKATPYLALGDSALVNELLIQPTLWESAPGQVHMLLRSSIGVICRSDSKDGGKTWSPVYKTSLPNPNSGIDVTKLPDGRLVLAYNPDNKNWGSRAPLILAVSADNGHTWPHQLVIEEGKGEDEFSYPAIISYGDSIAVTYTWQRRNVRFWNGTVHDILHK